MGFEPLNPSLGTPVKVRFTYINLKAAYAALAALCVRGRAVVQPRLKPKPELTDFSLQPYSRT